MINFLLRTFPTNEREICIGLCMFGFYKSEPPWAEREQLVRHSHSIELIPLTPNSAIKRKAANVKCTHLRRPFVPMGEWALLSHSCSGNENFSIYKEYGGDEKQPFSFIAVRECVDELHTCHFGAVYIRLNAHFISRALRTQRVHRKLMARSAESSV